MPPCTDALKGKKLLLVEDDVLLLMSLQDIVGDCGCKVVANAMALPKAITLARELALDLAVIDVNLQGEIVTPVADILAERGVPFVLATGYGAAVFDTRSASLVGRPLVVKPYTSEQVLAALLQALSRDAR